MNFLGFGQSAEVDIVFDGSENRKWAEVKTEDGKKEKYLLYYDGETVSGKVNVTLKKPGNKLEHHGIKIELIGQIELFYDRGNHHEFLSQVKELARPGDLIQNTSYPFEFPTVEKPYEVYIGSNVRLRYFLRVTIIRRLSDIVREVDIAVHTLSCYPESNSPIKMEVGIEDCLHIEFEYNKSKYHLKDVIVGKIYFLLVRIKIKHMEIAIIKRETTGSGPNIFTENETIAKYEIMDGAPVKGESIPIRVFLAGYDLTPTMRDVNKKFSVKYFLNLVLMDTEDRRYFKQQEIQLWRKADKPRKLQSQAMNPHVPMHLVGSSENEILSKYNNNSLGDNGNSSDGTGTMDNRRNDERTTTNPQMGLFTRESPQQESIHIQQSNSDNEQRNKLQVETLQQSCNKNPRIHDYDDKDYDDGDDDNDNNILISSNDEKIISGGITNQQPQQRQQQQQESKQQSGKSSNETTTVTKSTQNSIIKDAGSLFDTMAAGNKIEEKTKIPRNVSSSDNVTTATVTAEAITATVTTLLTSETTTTTATKATNLFAEADDDGFDEKKQKSLSVDKSSKIPGNNDERSIATRSPPIAVVPSTEKINDAINTKPVTTSKKNTLHLAEESD